MNFPRSRHRSTVVCTFCKRRKIRCDRNVPCSSCVAHGNPVCEYQSPITVSTNSNTQTSKPEVHSNVRKVQDPSNNVQLQPVSPMESELMTLRSKVEQLENLLRKRHEIPQDTPIWKYRTNEFILRALGYNPTGQEAGFVSPQDCYVSFDQMGNTFRNYGPLSWVAMINNDPALAPIINYRRAEIQKSQNRQDGDPQGTIFSFDDNKDAVVKNELDFVSVSQRAHSDRFTKEKLAAYNYQARNIGFPVCTTDFLQENDLLEKIRLLLPQESAMWTYIDLYFSKVYPFFPFLDQDTFEKHVGRLVKNNPGSPIQIKVEKQKDFIFLAQLLLVLRFGYLTLFPAIISERTQLSVEREYLLDNPVTMECIEIAKLCLRLFNFLRKDNLAIFQLLLLIKVYYMHAPEYGESHQDSNTQAFTSLLIKMAISLGLHREPENLKSANTEKKLDNLHRKLWYYLLYLDYDECINNGLPFSLMKNHYDTEVPHLIPGLENARDPDTERMLTIFFFKFNSCYDLTRPILNQLTAISSPIALDTFCADLTNWEYKYFRTSSVVLKYINGPLTVENIYEALVHFQLSILFAASLYYLYQFFHKTGNIDISYFYLKKIVIGVLKDLAIISNRFIKYGEVWFSHTSHVVFVSVFLNFIQRGVVILHGLIMKIRFAILGCEKLPDHLYRLNSDPEYSKHYLSLVNLYEKIETCFGLFLRYYSKLGRRYCTSWRATKAHEILQKARRGEDYYLNFCKDVDGSLKISTEMIIDLSAVFDDIIKESGVFPEQAERQMTTSSGYNGMEMLNSQNDISDFISDFWLQLILMKGHSDESVAESVNMSFDIFN